MWESAEIVGAVIALTFPRVFLSRRPAAGADNVCRIVFRLQPKSQVKFEFEGFDTSAEQAVSYISQKNRSERGCL